MSLSPTTQPFLVVAMPTLLMQQQPTDCQVTAMHGLATLLQHLLLSSKAEVNAPSRI
jgi:hypothetical protein